MSRTNEDNNNAHIFDAKHIQILESKERKNWQNPDEIMRQLELKSSQVVADQGCGSGYFTIPISRKVKKVYAIDVQKEMLDYLENKIQQQKIENIKTLLSENNNIPLPDERVDLLISVNTLHEFRDKGNTINEIRRVLKQNGRAVIVDFKKEDTEFGPPVEIRISKAQAKILFEQKGLNVIKTYDLKNHYLIVFQKQ